MKSILKLFISFLALITYSPLFSQGTSVSYDLSSLAQKNLLELYNRQITAFSEEGKHGIRFSKAENDGVAWLKHVIFSNGTIEVDIRGKDVFQQSFVGVAFHGTDNKTMDVIYFRPFNFNVADTVRKAHAVQYVSMPEYPWEVLRDKYQGKYEKPVSPSPDGTAWFHVKIVVKSPSVTVFINGSEKPCLTVEKLNTRASGKIGLWAGNNSDGDFANLKIY